MNKQKICLLLCSIRNVLVIICHILNKYNILFRVILVTELETTDNQIGKK